MLNSTIKDNFIITLEMLKVTYPKIKLPKYLDGTDLENYKLPSYEAMQRFLSSRGTNLIRTYINKTIYKRGKGTSLKNYQKLV